MGLVDILLPLVTVVSIVLTGAILSLPSRYVPAKDKKGRVAVLVLGDIGRSPRMQYHAISLATNGWGVDLIGYDESAPRPEILSESLDIKIYPLPPPPAFIAKSSRSLFPLVAPLKVLFQVSALVYLLLYIIKPPSYILIQNPPSIPTLAISHLTSILRNSRLVIDWHNFGYTILGIKLGNSHPLVKISKWYEGSFGKGAYANFTVTDKMATVLKKDFGITTPILTLHDRPPSHFQPFSQIQRDRFLSSHPLTADYFPSTTTKLLISSTSWTPDEDFSILLSALNNYATLASSSTSPKSKSRSKSSASTRPPTILAIITGKGPLLDHYKPLISALNSKSEFVTIRTGFLPAEEYPRLLACADLGVCLHTSSSGVDLPMKVVDMFGVGVPVAAVGFEAIGELVVDGRNGVVFGGSEELGEVLGRLLGGDSDELEILREGAMKEVGRRWEGEWNSVARQVFEGTAVNNG